MIASVSSAARVSRCGFTRRNRRTNSPLSGSVRNCQPPATSVRTMPLTPSRWMPPSCPSASSRRALSTPVASWSWSSVTGLSVTKRSDSTTVLTRSGDRRRFRWTIRSKGSNSSGCSSISAGSTSSSSTSDGGGATDCTSASLNGTALPGRSPGFSGVLTLFDLRCPAVECAGLRRHPDFLRSLVLVHAEQTQLHHLQQREEGDHDRPPRPLTLEQLDEGDPLTGAEPGGDALHRRGQRQLIADHLVTDPRLEGLEHAVQRLDQPVDAHLGQGGRLDLRRGRRGDPPGEDLAVEQRVLGELAGHVLVLLVLEQPPDQLGPRVALLLRGLARLRRLRPRQEQPALDVGERGRHHQELACDVEVEGHHLGEGLVVLLGDERDGDVEDVELVLADQVEQQIERSLEAGQLDL